MGVVLARSTSRAYVQRENVHMGNRDHCFFRDGVGPSRQKRFVNLVFRRYLGLGAFLKFFDHARVGERRRVAELAAFRDVAQ